MKAKKLREALQQMAEEGVVQVFLPLDGSPPIVGVVGALQLDVLKERLAAEYDLPIDFETARFTICRWVSAANARRPRRLHRRAIAATWRRTSTARRCSWRSSAFMLNYEIERAPKIAFSDIKDYQRQAIAVAA